MKILKYLKYIILIWLALSLLLFVSMIIKFNIELNDYINQEEPKEISGKMDAENQKTEVYILGSVHFETSSIKRDDMYHILSRISPDIILFESDSSTVAKIVNRTDFFWQVVNGIKGKKRVESFISHRYLNHHPEAKVLAYEWEERDMFHWKNDLGANSSALLRAVLKMDREKKLSEEESAIVNQYRDINNKYFQLTKAETVRDFNNSVTDSIIRIRQSYVYKKLPEIAIGRKEVEELKDFIPLHMEYWDVRNLAMTKNILKQIKRYPNKRFVVLNGYTHRYYLRDELKKYQDEFNFSLKEI